MSLHQSAAGESYHLSDPAKPGFNWVQLIEIMYKSQQIYPLEVSNHADHRFKMCIAVQNGNKYSRRVRLIIIPVGFQRLVLYLFDQMA